jgi:hypothetical protein
MRRGPTIRNDLSFKSRHTYRAIASSILTILKMETILISVMEFAFLEGKPPDPFSG